MIVDSGGTLILVSIVHNLNVFLRSNPDLLDVTCCYPGLPDVREFISLYVILSRSDLSRYLFVLTSHLSFRYVNYAITRLLRFSIENGLAPST